MSEKKELEVENKESKIKNFSCILESLETTKDKKKQLLLEAYQNALEDREDAGILLSDLMMQTVGNSATHVINGPIMTKYLERKSKANDQILKLIELLLKEEDRSSMSNDEIFDQITG